MADSQLFEEVFNITGLDNKKYDRCSRVTGTSEDSQTIMSLDLNHELWSCQVGDRIQICLATTLSLDGTKPERGWREPAPGEEDLSAMYDYVCYGKVYRFTEGDADSIKVYVSFGGLLLYIHGPFKKLTPLRIENVYLLCKKV